MDIKKARGVPRPQPSINLHFKLFDLAINNTTISITTPSREALKRASITTHDGFHCDEPLPTHHTAIHHHHRLSIRSAVRPTRARQSTTTIPASARSNNLQRHVPARLRKRSSPSISSSLERKPPQRPIRDRTSSLPKSFTNQSPCSIQPPRREKLEIKHDEEHARRLPRGACRHFSVPLHGFRRDADCAFR